MADLGVLTTRTVSKPKVIILPIWASSGTAVGGVGSPRSTALVSLFAIDAATSTSTITKLPASSKFMLLNVWQSALAKWPIAGIKAKNQTARRPFYQDFGNLIDLYSSTCIGMIGGIVKIDGSPAPDIRVALHHRDTGTRFGLARTNQRGEFLFTDLDIRNQCYCVTALDPVGGNMLNAVIYDYITPAPNITQMKDLNTAQYSAVDLETKTVPSLDLTLKDL